MLSYRKFFFTSPVICQPLCPGWYSTKRHDSSRSQFTNYFLLPLRRYNRLQSRYSRLRLTSDGEQLRDPLIQNEDGDEDEGLHPQPGGSFRYVPVATQNAELDSDEDLLDNLNPGE